MELNLFKLRTNQVEKEWGQSSTHSTGCGNAVHAGNGTTAVCGVAKSTSICDAIENTFWHHKGFLIVVQANVGFTQRQVDLVRGNWLIGFVIRQDMATTICIALRLG